MIPIVSAKRPKITVAATLSIFPYRKRYAEQLYGFYRSLSRKVDIDLVLLTNLGSKISKREIAPGFTEIQVAKSPQHYCAEAELQKTIGVPIGDVSLPKLHFMTPNYLEVLAASAQDANFLVTSHPYFFPILQEIRHKTFWYEAHNVEAELKKRFLPPTQEGNELWKQIQLIESECCQASDLILTFSDDISQGLSQYYAIDTDKIITLPYGVNTANIPYITYDQRLMNKRELGIEDQFIAIFMGNRHLTRIHADCSVNSSAIRSILALASKLPDMKFLVLGNSGLSFSNHMSPPNVSFMGIVSQVVKSLVFGIADVAINSTDLENYSNLTTLDYLSSGIPFVSTSIGAISLGLEPQKHYLVAENWSFPEALTTIQREDVLMKKARLKNARDYVEANYDWNVITDQLFDKINSS